MSQWYFTGGRRARTRISVREWEQRERERKQATEVSIETGPRLEWPDRALDYLWGRDLIPNDLTGDLRALLWAGTEDLSVSEACEDYRLDEEKLGGALKEAGLPKPLRWLRLGQGLAAMELVYTLGRTKMRAAREVGLPSSWALYKRMRRHLMTPDEVETLPAPRWRGMVDGWWEEWA